MATVRDLSGNSPIGTGTDPTIPSPSGGGGGGDATAANQASSNTKLDEIKALITTGNANTDTLETKIQTLIDDNTAAATYSPPRFVQWTPSVDTAAIAGGDVIAATEVISGFGRANDVGTVLIGISVIDKTDNTAANLDLTFVFFNSNVALGTENAASTISDSDAEHILGVWHISATDWVDYGGVKHAFVCDKRIPLQMITGTDDVAVAVWSPSAGAPTFSASAMVVTFTVLD